MGAARVAQRGRAFSVERGALDDRNPTRRDRAARRGVTTRRGHIDDVEGGEDRARTRGSDAMSHANKFRVSRARWAVLASFVLGACLNQATRALEPTPVEAGTTL